MRRFLLLFFLVIAALIGTSIGLHFAGVIDLKKIYLSAVYPYAIKIPYVGKYVERFTSELKTRFTSIERRRMELEAWAKRLRALEEKLKREIPQKEAELKTEKLEEEKKKLEELTAKLTKELSAKKISDEEAKRLASYYAAMRPSEAAAILTNLDDNLAIAILKHLDQEKVAKILASLDPTKAAQLISKMGRENK